MGYGFSKRKSVLKQHFVKQTYLLSINDFLNWISYIEDKTGSKYTNRSKYTIS